LHISPTGVVALLLGLSMVTLLLRAILVTNTERVVALQPVALLAMTPTPPPPEAKKPPEPQPQQVEQLDSKSWTAQGPTEGSPGPRGGPIAANGPLGLAEAGEGGTDAFGLAGRPGGTELLLTGGGGGGGNGRFTQFGQQLEAHVQHELNRQDGLKKVCYTADILVWLTPTGVVQEARIRKSTGQLALDAEIQRALESLRPLEPAPPAGIPWPVGLRIVSHRADCPEP
jgi:periplasmic protein TonB